jgi:excisionase family DNA binding protein
MPLARPSGQWNCTNKQSNRHTPTANQSLTESEMKNNPKQQEIIIRPKGPSIDAKAAYGVAETAELLSLGLTSTRAQVKEGRIRIVRLGRAIIIPRTEIDAFLAREVR